MLQGLIWLTNGIYVEKPVLGTLLEDLRTTASMLSKTVSRHANANDDLAIQAGTLVLTVHGIVRVSLVLKPWTRVNAIDQRRCNNNIRRRYTRHRDLPRPERV